MYKILTALSLLSACTIASAVTHAVPEPGSFALVGLGLVAAVIVGVRKKK